jgi:nucleotidyltransferase/DNA polymerase involved in DNA repair
VNQEQETTGPGIVVLSPYLEVLFMNRRAMVLLNQLEHTAQSIGTERVVAAPLHQHCQDIIETMRARLSSNNWEQFQQYRTIGDSPQTILLKGFGLPDRRGLSHSRIVMQLSPHTAQSIPEISREESSSIIARIPSQEEPMAYGQ